MEKQSYSDKLKDVRWQKKRLEILEANDFICQRCLMEGKTVHVHHKLYRWDTDPWDYEDDCFVILCEDCHHQETIIRKVSFKRLSETIQKNFYAKGMDDLSAAFDDVQTKVGYSNELIAGAINFWLSDPKLCEMFMQTYFQYLQNKEA